ncbi:MAG: TolC family protein [Acidobacteria bacterium]|uniref:TolC family protein n=1 Tax=Edaphobacter flagellatus TaxID=1933044 RepID=UPI001DDA1F86|nr:TolC family protein [Edaphobacter flagellatus]MBS1815452.1 TolC family protein [Acidobacteriota bacterium]
MRLPLMVAALVLATGAAAQDNSMPGMQMPAKSPAKPAKQQSRPAPKAKQPAKGHDMSGMDMGQHTGHTTPQHDMDNMPGMRMDHTGHDGMQGTDMGQHDAGKPSKGTDMQNMQGMHMDMPMAEAPQQGSVTHDTLSLQEPENPSRKTGKNDPVPELLKDVVTRPRQSLADFLAMSDRSNPTVSQANALAQRSAAQAKQAGLYPNPSIGYQGDQIRGGSYGGGEHGAYVQQTIVLGGKLGARRDIYRQQQRSDEIGVEAQTFRVHGDVSRAFYAALTAQALVDVRRRLLGVALDAVETVHQLANVGQADAPDILQTEVEAEQAKVDFLSAQQEFLQRFRTLAAYAGQRSLAPSLLAGDLEHPPEIDTEQQVANIIANSPEVRRAQQEIAVAEARLKDARREPIPDLTLRAGEQYNGELVRENPNVHAGPQSIASANLAIPLWNRNQGNKDAARVELERARQSVARTQLFLQQQTAPVAQSYQTARFTANRYREELIPRAQRAYQLYLQKYQAMAQAYPQVLVSQRTLFQLQVGYLNALHEAWDSAVMLQNFNLSGGLTEPEPSGSGTTTINLPATGSGSNE